MFKFLDEIPLIAWLFGKSMHKTEFSRCGKRLRTYKAKSFRGILYIYKEIIHGKECDKDES